MTSALSLVCTVVLVHSSITTHVAGYTPGSTDYASFRPCLYHHGASVVPVV